MSTAGARFSKSLKTFAGANPKYGGPKVTAYAIMSLFASPHG